MESERLFNFFDQLEQSFIGEAIRNSIWMFPVIEAFHLIGLAILGGSILVGDLRLLGLLLSTKPIVTLAAFIHNLPVCTDNQFCYNCQSQLSLS